MAAMVGRAAEQVEIAAALAAARDGQGRLVLVGGPAGIGKTCLVDHAAASAAAMGLPVARGYAIDDPGAPALWPWQRALRDRPDAAALLTSAESDAEARFRMFVR